MALDLNRDTPLFDESLLVELHSTGQDTRNVNLVVRVLSGTRQHIQGQQERIIHFEVADDSDPYFLYVLDVGEQDFHNLKRDQSILVDFGVFPTMFIELLAQCASIDDEDEDEDTSPFMVRLDCANGYVSIIESTQFKQVNHISIQLRAGNDSSIKSYLASRMNHTMASNARCIKEVNAMRDQLDSEKAARLSLSEELREIRSHRDVDIQSLRASHSEELSRAQIKAAEVLEEERSTLGAEVKLLRKNADEFAVTTKARISELESSVAEEQRNRSQLDFKNRELARDLEMAINDRERLLADSKILDGQHKELISRNGVLEREMARAEARVEALSEQLKDKDQLEQRSNELIRAAEDGRNNAEDKISMYASSIQSLKDKLTSAVGEINKGNQLISSMQTDANRAREVIAAKNEVLRKQEMVMSDLRTRIGENGRQIDAQKESFALKEKELAHTAKELQGARERLEEGANVIKSNQEVITWLNRELSRYQLHGPGLASEGDFDNYGASSLSNFGQKENVNINFSPDSIKGRVTGTPDTDITQTTRASTLSGMSSSQQEAPGSAGSGSVLGLALKSFAGKNGGGSGGGKNGGGKSGSYKESYEYLKSMDALGGMEDIDMAAIGLEVSQTDGGYYDLSYGGSSTADKESAARRSGVGNIGASASASGTPSGRTYGWMQEEYSQ